MHLPRQRRFPLTSDSVRAARDFAVGTLAEWGLTERRDDIRLCVSELATNALLHGAAPGGDFRVRVEWNGELIRIEVRDDGAGRPVPRAFCLDADGGRGMWLIAELADDHGVLEHGVGKTVWLAFKFADVLAASAPDPAGLLTEP